MTNIWIDSEGDNWFDRNKGKIPADNDFILELLEKYQIHPRNVLEIGCANGYRLVQIHDKYSCSVIGVEPSAKAIIDGKTKWKYITFIHSLCESFEVKEKADLIIINFVLHWVTRPELIKCIYNIDKSLSDGGFLIIGDFGTDNFIKRKYHHLPDANIWTYKQEYSKIFTSTGLYLEIARMKYNHNAVELTSNIDNSDMATISLFSTTELTQRIREELETFHVKDSYVI